MVYYVRFFISIAIEYNSFASSHKIIANRNRFSCRRSVHWHGWSLIQLNCKCGEAAWVVDGICSSSSSNDDDKSGDGGGSGSGGQQRWEYFTRCCASSSQKSLAHTHTNTILLCKWMPIHFTSQKWKMDKMNESNAFKIPTTDEYIKCLRGGSGWMFLWSANVRKIYTDDRFPFSLLRCKVTQAHTHTDTHTHHEW